MIHIYIYSSFMMTFLNKGNSSDTNYPARDSAMHIVFNSIAEPVFIIDAEGRIIEANKAFAAIFGKEVQECINANVYDLLPPELAKSRKEKADEAISTKKQVIFEDEREGFFIRHTLNPIADDKCRISWLYVISQNITEFKLAERHSINQKAFRKELIESIPGAYYLLDVEGRYVDWNAYQRDVVVGKQEHEMANFFAINTVHPDDRARVLEKQKNIIKYDVEESEEVRILIHGGPEIRWYRISGKKILINGETFFLGIGSDINDRKIAEEAALKNSEDRFRKLFEGHSSVMLVIDKSGKIINANPAAAIFYGWTVEELKMMRTDQISMSSIESVIDNINQTNISEAKRLSGIHKRADGSSRDVEIKINTIVIDGKELLYAIINDITERKQAEEALRKSERNFRTITEQMAEVLIVVDLHGTVTYASPVSEKMFGYLPDELIGRPFTEYLSEEHVPEALAIFNNIVINQVDEKVFEFQFKHKNGSRLYGEVHVRFYHDHEFHGIIGLIRDITESKHNEMMRLQYEQELKESQQFLASIYDEVNHSIFVVDILPGGSYIYKGINTLYEKLTGMSDEDIFGKSPQQLFAPEIADTVISRYDACLQAGRSIQYEECMPYKGKDSWWETVLNPVRNKTGNIHRIIGTSSNITERKLAESQIKKLSTAIEQSPAIVVITDPEGNIEFVNPMFVEITGYTAEEVKGQNPRILKSGLMPQTVYEELWKTILSGDVWYGELQNKKKNGELYWDQAVISAIHDKKGKITNYVAVKLDITEQKRILSELIASKDKAEESDRLKSAFVANISHEIRTPMNGILGFAQLLKDPQLTWEVQAEYIYLIQQSGERMLSLINNLINISRIEAGETILHPGETPVNELLHDLYAFFKPEMNKKGLQLNCITPLSDIESIIETDSGKLAQILTNLIQNALKFTSAGGIDYGYKKINDVLEFYVIDTGIGIALDMKEKIFDRFHQVDNPLTRTQEGAGLGLSISKAYVEMLGGTIRVESEGDQGSAFYFTLPYNPSGTTIIPRSFPINQMPVISLPDLTVLIAEDEAVSQLVLEMYLKSENITTLIAVNGQEAVILADHHPEINLILMDLKMPVMNGYEATALIKKIRPELPIIAQTAFTSKEEKQKAQDAGCDAFISKPINRNELLTLIDMLLNR